MRPWLRRFGRIHRAVIHPRVPKPRLIAVSSTV
jgi:hypothetical protein